MILAPNRIELMRSNNSVSAPSIGALDELLNSHEELRARVTELEQENAGLRSHLKREFVAQSTATSERIAQLEAQLAQAREDTVRLDTLIQFMAEDEPPFGTSSGMSLRPPMNGHGWRLYGFDGDFISEGTDRVNDPRSAIDASRTTEAPKAEAPKCWQCQGTGRVLNEAGMFRCRKCKPAPEASNA